MAAQRGSGAGGWGMWVGACGWGWCLWYCASVVRQVCVEWAQALLSKPQRFVSKK
jgi:hypothetical protein